MYIYIYTYIYVYIYRQFSVFTTSVGLAALAPINEALFKVILFPSYPPGTTSNRRNVGVETTIPKDDKMFSNHPENRRGMLSVVNSIVSSVIQTTSELHKAMSSPYKKTLIKRILVEMFVDYKYFIY